MAACTGSGSVDRKPCWLTTKKAAGKYVREARGLMVTQDPREVMTALSLLDSALSLSPRMEMALELKARCLLHLRRFKDVAEMLRDYIPSLKLSGDDAPSGSSSSSSEGSSQPLSRERAGLPHSSSSAESPGFKCFSLRELMRWVMGGIWKNCRKQGRWRYSVLGQACCHLGLLEDAMVLLQTGKRLATAAFRRESICWPDDSFTLTSLHEEAIYGSEPNMPPHLLAEVEFISQLLFRIKLLIRRRTAAVAALDAGLNSEAIRHFAKILDSRHCAPQGFLAECYMHRATAYRSLGRIAESIADCNRTLALQPSGIQALETRAALLEAVRCLPDCLHDLEHLRLLYNTILRSRKLPGQAWKRQYVHYREIPGRICVLSAKIQGLKQRIASGDTGNVDYYALMGLRRGCSRSELERAYRLLSLKHKPDKAVGFIDNCEFADPEDRDSVKDRARMMAMLLYRLIQKGYKNITASICKEEDAEKERQRSMLAKAEDERCSLMKRRSGEGSRGKKVASVSLNPSIHRGVFCRDLATVHTLLSQVRISRPVQAKSAAIGC
ncbi:hypothetical protein MLD38_040030 [Melastoma candidum]|uniref:Uncharacterized protein n=1 Tax=Melastoma candidum TaxID=119954 RepID=A0ACB9L432_9MYRT|nr:hypothetical protein MLD38_040030 [Melastoma candidum]